MGVMMNLQLGIIPRMGYATDVERSRSNNITTTFMVGSVHAV